MESFALRRLLEKLGEYEPDVRDLVIKLVPPCPNRLLCGGVKNNNHGVCYDCDHSLYGFTDKARKIFWGIYPSVDYTAFPQSQHHIKEELMIKLRRSTYHILTIQEKEDYCCNCYDKKNIFITHPTCNIHEICRECFKNDFLDQGIKIPVKPPSMEKFNDFVLLSMWEDRVFDYDRFDGFSIELGWYFDYPLDNWPEDIKAIYSECRRYDKNIVVYERKLNNNTNNRSCPVCNEIKLKI